MTLTCLQRLCCLNAEDEYSDKRPEIVVISSQPDKDTSSIPDSFVSSSVVTGKFDKAGSRGSVSEEDSGVGSCRDTSNQSDAADQTDTSSQSEDTVSTKLRRSDSTLSSMSAILPTREPELDLTAEIAAELEQMNGFSLEETGSIVFFSHTIRNVFCLINPFSPIFSIFLKFRQSEYFSLALKSGISWRCRGFYDATGKPG
ncbi:unnamed protein product [Oikopleura dioica]|uniref:Uncharacterized protein n=1 Tax=Oikopleura dioica TaxID=34765 RepID=E4YA03_OIKDI|nr:unnamed protein product [Oikopleura dioica]